MRSEHGANGLPTSAAVPSVQELVTQLSSRGVRMIRVCHADLHGRCRSKELPVRELQIAADGLGYCLISMVEDLRGNPVDIEGFADSPFADMQAVADLSSVRVTPWAPDTAWLLADLRGDRGLSPRRALARASEELAAEGLTAMMAPELEFYLLRRGRTREAIDRYGAETGPAYVSGSRADPAGAFRRIHRALDQAGLGVTAAQREFSPGQFEINLRHGPALEAADRAFAFKEAVRELAAAEGLEANFMAKPFSDGEGSSFHVHVSLLRDGENAFAGPEPSSPPTEECRHFLAGVLAHAPGLTALGAPTVNSYRRLVAKGMVPTRADWADDDRFTYVRIPPERGHGSRLEVRAGDASANPYLFQAAILIAGLDGLRRKLTPPPPRRRGHAGEPVDAASQLPLSLGAALDALEADATLVDGFGRELVRTFAAIKRDETERERRHVSDWDWREYAADV